MAFEGLMSHSLSLEVITFEHYVILLGLDITLLGFYLMYISFLALCRGKLRGRPHLFYVIDKLCGQIVLGWPHI
jgi:hypothetical protein